MAGGIPLSVRFQQCILRWCIPRRGIRDYRATWTVRPLTGRGVASTSSSYTPLLAKAVKGTSRHNDANKSPHAGINSKICTGANYHIEGTDPQLKDDSEYPDWLWTLLDEVPKDSKTYIRRMRKLALRMKNREMKRNK